MAEFEPALDVLLSWEGGYSFNPKDPGGETYCGISRRNWPNWSGWELIDEVKKIRQIKFNEIFDDKIASLGIESNIPSIGQLVNSFYLQNYWSKESYATINDQDIANKVFQHHVNMGIRAIKLFQQALEGMEVAIVKIDGTIGPQTASACNYLTSNRGVLLDYVELLTEYYDTLIKENPQLKVFEHEWMLRAKTIGKRP
jgi:lysozyme family protein